MKLGGRTMVGDESLVYFHINKQLAGLVSIHTGDFQLAGTEEFKKTVVEELVNTIKISMWEIGQFMYTGVGLIFIRKTMGIFSYVKQIIKIYCRKFKFRKTTINPDL